MVRQFAALALGVLGSSADTCSSSAGTAAVGISIATECGLQENDCCVRCFLQRQNCVAANLKDGCCTYYSSTQGTVADASNLVLFSGTVPTPEPIPVPTPVPVPAPVPAPVPVPTPAPGTATFNMKSSFHDAQPALDYVIVHPDCVATVYDFASGTFSEQRSDTFTNVACNDPLGHVKATLNVSGLSQSCADTRANIQKWAGRFGAGHDSSGVNDPHGTGKGYVESPDAPAGLNLQFIRLAGVGGKGMPFYQDTVHFEFREVAEGCDFDAASQSQVSAGGDASTNACNIFNLVNEVAAQHGQLREFVGICCTNDVPCAASASSVVA